MTESFSIPPAFVQLGMHLAQKGYAPGTDFWVTGGRFYTSDRAWEWIRSVAPGACTPRFDP